MTPAHVSDGVLVGPNNMTLYTFAKDQKDSGKSVCVDKCEVNWPPLKAEADANAQDGYTIITRDDGSKLGVSRYATVLFRQRSKTW